MAPRLRVETDRFVNRFECFVERAQARERITAKYVGQYVVRLHLQGGVGTGDRILRFPGREQQGARGDLHVDVFGKQIRCANVLVQGSTRVTRSSVGKGQLLPGFPETSIEVDGVPVLDDGRRIVPFIEIAISALEIFLLLDRGIGGTARSERNDCEDSQTQIGKQMLNRTSNQIDKQMPNRTSMCL